MSPGPARPPEGAVGSAHRPSGQAVTGMGNRSLLCLLAAVGPSSPSAGSTPPSPGDSAVTVFTPHAGRGRG